VVGTVKRFDIAGTYLRRVQGNGRSDQPGAIAG
jgi:hypothetical protein